MTTNLTGNDSAALKDSLQPATHPALLAADYMAYRVAEATHVYVLPVIVFIGLIGNSLSFLIMLKPHNRRISCCNYIACLAVSDNLMLLNALDYWTISLKKRPLFYIECNIMSYLFGANSFVSMLLIFAMTVDRFLAIRFPFKARELCSPYRARVAIVFIIVVSLLYTLPYFFTAQLIMEARTCVAVNTTDIYSTIYNWVNIFLGSIVPFFGLLTMNAVIIATVRRRGNFSVSAGEKEKSVEKSTKKPIQKPIEKPKEEPAETTTKKNAEKSTEKTEPTTERETKGQENPVFQDENMSESPINFAMHTTNEQNHIDNDSVNNATENHRIVSHQQVRCMIDSEAEGVTADDQQYSSKTVENVQNRGADKQNDKDSPETIGNCRNSEIPRDNGISNTESNANGTNSSQKKKISVSMKATPSLRSHSSLKWRVGRAGSRDNQLTIMLLLVTFTFLLLTVPLYVRYLLAIFWNYAGSVKHYADYLLLAHLSNRFFYMNSACNFFLYCISGNKFRQDVIALFVDSK